ncbi:uncharacterized protein LOC122850928 [Aphidius gifuensis]|uniref:uncharacterized protein LOC122850928 n=1 Tax=Aphidius gifuensis TaxID=684658 RepID=UPI001CDCB28D|nr:uncharacterized protein LOC122850928 [Aphidius gifuensis]
MRELSGLMLRVPSKIRIQTDIEESELCGSGWTLNEILNLEIHINDYVPLKGGNSSYISMPKWILNTRAVVNIKNNDNKCFIWSVLAAIHKLPDNNGRVNSYYRYEKDLIVDGIDFPMSWKSIKLFEKINRLRINVYGIEVDDDDDDVEDLPNINGKRVNISDELYNHASNVWEKFNIQTLGEYSDLYLRSDVILLADIFENFRETCLQAYKLDALHYYTAPGLSFDAMLKMTKSELELLTDPDMVLFIEKGIRGGLSQCSNRYGKANNRFMEEYDSSKPESYLMYFDVNNLYGGAMSQMLPTHDFKWDNDFDETLITSISNESNVGYIFEVDLEYPSYLHEQHKDLPLAPVHEKPPLPTSKCKKLLATLNPKQKYVVHYQSLKQYLSLGMKLIKIHRALRFKQSAWLKPYINLNTELRQQAKNEFEKSFFKLMNNAIYGKTMECGRNLREIKLVSKYEGRWGARSLISKPNFASSKIIDDLKKFNENAKYLYGETDSCIYQFTIPNIYDHIKEDIHKFDTSDYKVDNQYGIPLANKKVVGLMKDENNGNIMTEFIGLRSKLYSYKVIIELETRDKTHSRAKGVKRSAMKKIIFDDYKRCLQNEIEIFRKQNLLRSHNHNVRTITIKKKALSWQDDKRNLQRGSTDTLPWGYIPLINL